MTTTAASALDDPRASEILDIVAHEAAIPRETLRPEATIESLGIASLDMVQAIFAIESRFGVDIPVVASQGGAEFSTIGDLLAHVLHTLNAHTRDAHTRDGQTHDGQTHDGAAAAEADPA